MKTQEMIEEIIKIKENANLNAVKRYNFELTEKIILRLDSNSENCNECKNLLEDFSNLFEEIRDDSIFNLSKKYSILINKTLSHLQKNHKLVTEGYYTNFYMSLGISLGLSFGLIFSQSLDQTTYLGIGIPIGVGIGVSIGSNLDAKAKKDGLVI